MNRNTTNILESQAVAEFVLDGIQKKAQEQASVLADISANTDALLKSSINALSEANTYIEKARDFVSPGNLNHILGSRLTKHGEIAENLEVNFRNGRDVLNHLKATAHIMEEGMDRIGPTDYVINGSTPIQSKFINGNDISSPNKSLSHIYEHLKKYPGFATDATPYGFPGQQGIYHIPKDQFENLQKVISGNTGGLSSKTVKSCQEFIDKIEQETGKSITDVIKPGVSSYRDVQLGRVDQTIDAEEQAYSDIHKEEVHQIRQHKEQQRAEAQHITDASWSEAFKAAGIGAAISGAASVGINIYIKIKQGKKITDFTIDDWKDVGIDFAKGSAKGGITGLAVYGLTKVGGFSAPFAGSIVTTSIGITSLYIDYKNGKIALNDFVDASVALSVESGCAAIGAAIGQAVIPIPILGGIIGTVVAQSAYKLISNICGENEKALIAQMETEINKHIDGLNKEYKEIIAEINSYFQKLGGLIDAALSIEPNNRLNASIKLARFVGVNEHIIIHNNSSELDSFMQN